MRRKILVVDDNEVNRQILCKILSDDYEVLQAEDGKVALDVLKVAYETVSAVLLDISMPVMDGYEVMTAMCADKNLSQIPVLVTTGSTDSESEVMALSYGAKDFIGKPYNSEIIKHRIRNTINLRETSAYINEFKRDKLTGLYSREAFYERVAEMVPEHEPGYYVIACFDIDNFKVINDQYGSVAGDHVLQYIADVFQNGFEQVGGICSRITADNFAVLYPATFMESAEIKKMHREAAVLDGFVPPITFSIGRYIINDLSLSVSSMYDRAVIAETSIKGRFDVHIAQYDEIMRENILREQQIVNEMNEALESEQFEVWFQPQYNHSSGSLIGAEALVRWRHPKMGFVSPGVFIPVFEKNGFIYEMDKFVWKQVCAILRKWIDEGVSPLPVSVNISRYDLFRDDLIDVLTGYLKMYDIPTGLLRIEITESAFAKSSSQLIVVIKNLVSHGFTIEIDDFGSGYSSLNTLKDVPANILKLDMRFLEDTENTERGGNILESIVRMAKWLGMPVIAEGVETIAQAEYLKSIGCYYVQGFLYARPMPLSEYEALAARAGKEEEMLKLETVESLDNNAFWNPKSMDTLIFNSYVGGACIFEYCNDKTELLRVNDKYVKELLGDHMSIETAMKLEIFNYMDDENCVIVEDNILRAIKTRDESACEVKLFNLPNRTGDVYLRVTVKVIAKAGDRLLFYSTIINMTAQRDAERKEREASQQLNGIIDDVNGGVSAVTLKDNAVHFVFSNNRYYEILGYTREQFENEVVNALYVVHPDDRKRIQDRVSLLIKSGESDILEYRCIKRDGKIINVRCNASITSVSDIKDKVLLSVITEAADFSEFAYCSKEPDISQEKSYMKMLSVALADTMKSTKDLLFVKDKNFVYLCCSRAFANMVGLEDEKDIAGKTDFDFFCKELAQKYRDDDIKLLSGGESLTDYLEYIPSKDGLIRYSNTSKYLLHDAEGNIIGLYGISRDVTEDKTAFDNLRLLIDNIPGGLAMYEVSGNDIRTLYLSEEIYTLTGYSRDEYSRITQSNALKLVFEDDIEKVGAQVKALTENGTPMNVVCRLYMKNGGCCWVNVCGNLIEHSDGKSIVNAVIFDITDRMKAQEHLKISKEELTLAMSKIGRIICEYDPTCFVLTVPAVYAKQYNIEAVLHDIPYGVKQYNLLDENYTDDYIRFYEKIINGEKNGDIEVLMSNLDGTYHWERFDFSTIFDENGKPIKAIISVEDITKQHEKDYEAELTRNNERVLKLVAEHSNRLIFRYDLATRSAHSDSKREYWMQATSYNTDIPESAVRSGLILPESIDDYRQMFSDIHSGKPKGNAKIHMRADDGSAHWIDMKYSSIFGVEKKPVSAVISFLDITESHEKELAYERYQQEVELNAKNDSNLIYLEADVTADIAEKHGGIMIPEEFPDAGLTRTESINYIVDTYVVKHERDRCREYFSKDRLMGLYFDGVRNINEEWSIVFPNGDPGYIRSQMQLIQDPYSGHIKVYTTLRNITKEKLGKLGLQKQAEIDGMTELYNKTTVESLIKKKLCASDTTQCALLIADLDNLKAINDSYGHDKGDEVIRVFANELRMQFRKTDIVGRVGGDEFIIFMDGGGNEARIRGMIITFMKKLSDIRVSDTNDLAIHGSIGVAIGNDIDESYEELFKKADKALYHVKKNGKNDFAFYTPDMEQSAYLYKRHELISLCQTNLFDKDELYNLLQAVSEIYPMVISVNLTKNSYYMMQYDNYMTKSYLNAGSFDELVSDVEKSFHPDDRECFAEAFSRESLLAAHERGESVVSHNGRQLGDDNIYREIHTDVISVNNRCNDDVLDIILARQCVWDMSEIMS